MLEMLRVIREEEPSKPSTRLSSSDALPTLAANRGTEPAKLTKLVRGELDWIVMKALEKDRSRRYETANGFAADVQRYLADEPVQACPPSAGYRLRKFVRRHKGPVLAVSLVVLALVGGIIGTTWGLIRATDAQAVAVKEAKQKADALTAKDAALQAETRAKDKLRRDSYFHHITLAHRDLSADNLGRALKLLDECPEDLAPVGMALPDAALRGRAVGLAGQDGSEWRGVQPGRRATRLGGRGRLRQDLEQQDGQGDPDLPRS